MEHKRCDNCLLPDFDFEAVTAAREEFNPKRLGESVKVLFVAEAIANSGRWDEYPYFYFKKQRPTISSLYMQTMQAVFGDGVDYGACEKENYLEQFQSLGYYLLDAARCPVDKLRLSKPKRNTVIKNCAETHLIPEIRELKPASTILIKKNVFETLQPLLVKEGVNILNKSPIPFPGSGRQAEYRRRIRECLRLV